MKTTLTAAILLLGGCVLLAQPGFAGDHKDRGKPVVDCTYVATNPATACTDKNSLASTRLADFEGAFKKAQDYDSLTCKVAAAEDKMGQDKPEDAYYKLADAANKVDSLLTQGKLNLSAEQFDMLKSALDGAAECAYDEAFNP